MHREDEHLCGGGHVTAARAQHIPVIDVAAGGKIFRKGRQRITCSDPLVINGVDLAPYVGADLA